AVPAEIELSQQSSADSEASRARHSTKGVEIRQHFWHPAGARPRDAGKKLAGGADAMQAVFQAPWAGKLIVWRAVVSRQPCAGPGIPGPFLLYASLLSSISTKANGSLPSLMTLCSVPARRA